MCVAVAGEQTPQVNVKRIANIIYINILRWQLWKEIGIGETLGCAYIVCSAFLYLMNVISTIRSRKSSMRLDAPYFRSFPIGCCVSIRPSVGVVAFTKR